MFSAAVTLLIGLTGLPQSAAQGGQTSLEASWRACASIDSSISIAGCTAVIKSHGQSSAHLAVALINRGIAYRNQRAFARAIRDFSLAIHLRPNMAQTYLERGIARYALRQYDLAILDYDAAIRLRPDLAEGWNNRSLAYLKKADFDRATRDFNQTVRLNKNYGNAMINRSLGPLPVPEQR